jgi:hypothetical protein
MDASENRSPRIVREKLHESSYVPRIAVVMDELERCSRSSHPKRRRTWCKKEGEEDSTQCANPACVVLDFVRERGCTYPIVCIANEALAMLKPVAQVVRLHALRDTAADGLLQRWGCTSSETRRSIISCARGDARQLYYEFHLTRLAPGTCTTTDGLLNCFDTARQLLAPESGVKGTNTWGPYTVDLLHNNFLHGRCLDASSSNLDVFACMADTLSEADNVKTSGESEFLFESRDDILEALLTSACAVLRRSVRGHPDIAAPAKRERPANQNHLDWSILTGRAPPPGCRFS